jgi:hypothetical protein
LVLSDPVQKYKCRNTNGTNANEGEQSMSSEPGETFKARTADPIDHPTPRPDPSRDPSRNPSRTPPNDRPERGEHLPTMPDPAQNDPETGEHVPASIDPTEKLPFQNDPRPRDAKDSPTYRV